MTKDNHYADKSGFIISTDSTVTGEQARKSIEKTTKKDIIETTLFEYRLWFKEKVKVE